MSTIRSTKMKEISYNKFVHYFTGFVNWVPKDKQDTLRQDGLYFIVPGEVVVPINKGLVASANEKSRIESRIGNADREIISSELEKYLGISTKIGQVTKLLLPNNHISYLIKQVFGWHLFSFQDGTTKDCITTRPFHEFKDTLAMYLYVTDKEVPEAVKWSLPTADEVDSQVLRRIQIKVIDENHEMVQDVQKIMENTEKTDKQKIVAIKMLLNEGDN